MKAGRIMHNFTILYVSLQEQKYNEKAVVYS